jgi:ATP-dependent Lon protease
LTSLISGRLVKPGLGMTGEITLRGQVLPIGGLKEKVLAAHRNGLRTVVLPKRNKPDLEDVPEEIQKAMQFIFAENVDEVLAAALDPAKKKPRKTKSTKPKGSQARKKKLSIPEDSTNA